MPPRPRYPGRFIWMTMAVFAVSLVILLLWQQPPAVGSSPKNSISPGAGNLMALTVQIYPGSEAIVLIDKDRQTLCLYQYRPDVPPHEGFALLAARNFRNDFELEDFNNAEPTPATIRNMIDKMMSPAVPEKLPAVPSDQ